MRNSKSMRQCTSVQYIHACAYTVNADAFSCIQLQQFTYYPVTSAL